MRTKKILSILLVMIMALGALAIGASAVELVGEAAVAQASKGWAAEPNPFPIYDESAIKATGMDKAVVLWVPFSNEDGNATADGSFYKLSQTRKPGVSTYQAICEWNAYKVEKEGGLETNKGKFDVRTSNSYGTGAYYTIAANEVYLYLLQGDTTYYGWVRVELTVKVDTNDDGVVDSEKSAIPVWVYLADPTDLAKKINEAKKEVAKSERYTKDYIDNLNRRIKNASELLTQNAEQTLVDYHMGLLNSAIAGTDFKADGTPVGNKWKLSGVDFIDNLLGQGFIAFIWQAYDVINTTIETVKPLIDFFGQIGTFFGYLMPFFSILGGFIGL